MISAPLNKWIPGVLSNFQMRQLCKPGWIEGDVSDEQIGYSALDLTLTGEGYYMLQGCVKPFGESYEQILKNKAFAKPLGKKDSFVLIPKKTYIFRIQQRLGHQLLSSDAIYGQATAKSSVGRMDVLARLIVDGMKSYEGFTPDFEKGASGQMYLEITPITFKVRVKEGVALSQLRFFYGKPEDCEVSGKELYGSVLPNSSGDGFLSVNLKDVEVGKGQFGCAFCANTKRAGAISLWKEKAKPLPDPKGFWKLQKSSKGLTETQSERYFKINKDAFYIIRSKELISLPAGIAVYCRAIDETIGEMRIHYAGFVHPLFGRERQIWGTPLIFEVRGHDVEVTLTDGEKMARLTFYRMSDHCKVNKKQKSGYEEQSLKLSGFFAAWK
jgi:dCTP deaminase